MALWVKTLATQWCKPDPLCDLSLSLCVCVSLCLFLRVCVSLPLCVSLLSVSHSKRKTKKDTESVRTVHSIKTIKTDSLVQHSLSYSALWRLFLGYLITLGERCLLIGSVKSWMANS